MHTHSRPLLESRVAFGRVLPLWAPPALTALTALAACVLLTLVDPTVGGRYPTCPFLALTGRWCPGCGSLRAGRQLLMGHPLAALDLNPLTVLALPIAAYSWAAWASPRCGLRALPVLRPGPRATAALACVTLVYWVARNLPWWPWSLLAP